MANSSFKYRHAPFKWIYLFANIAAGLLLIPLYIAWYTRKAHRQRVTWPRGRAVRVAMIRFFAVVAGNTGPFLPRPTYKAIEPSEEAEGVWIPPMPESMIYGEIKKMAEIAQAKPIRIPGYWYGKKPSNPPGPEDRVVYSLHGGSYVSMSAHPKNFAVEIPRGILQWTKIETVFALEYRLSNYKPFTPVHPFPTALFDAIAGYLYLIELGYKPENIIVEGDSAGANLSLALVRYLIESNGAHGLPSTPGGLILFSPWTDLSLSHIVKGSSAYWETDYLGSYTEDDPQWAHHAFLHPYGIEIAGKNRYISPACLYPEVADTISFKGFPRTFIACGGAELLHDQIATLDRIMKKDTEVEYYEPVDAVHDWVQFAWHEPERSETFQILGKWLEQ